MTTSDERERLRHLNVGDVFSHLGTDYVLVKHNRTRSVIGRLRDGKRFTLPMTAPIIRTGNKDYGLVSRMESKRFEQANAISEFRIGQKVRFADVPATRKAGLAGTVSYVERVNTKTVATTNGYRVTPGLLEVIDDE